jgi:hypothetical protein
MTKGELLANYCNSSPEDQRKFDRWLKANVVVAAVFALGLMAMAVNSTGLPGPDTATAKSSDKDNTAAALNGSSAYELMIRLGRDLPVRQTTDPF